MQSNSALLSFLLYFIKIVLLNTKVFINFEFLKSSHCFARIWVTNTAPAGVDSHISIFKFMVSTIYMSETYIMVRQTVVFLQAKNGTISQGTVQTCCREYTGFSFYINIGALDQTGNPAELLLVAGKFVYAHSICHGICCPEA